MLLFSAFLALIVSVLGLDVSAGEIVSFELQVGTLTAIGSLKFKPDYCLHTPIPSEQPRTSTSATTATTNASPIEPTKTLYVSETTVQTVYVTVTVAIPPPTSQPSITSICTVGTTGTMIGTAPTNSTPVGTISFTRLPTTTANFPVISGGSSLSQRAWHHVTLSVIVFSLLFF